MAASDHFRRQIQLAFKQQQAEHEQSIARFTSTLASLCANDALNPYSISQALGSLGNPTKFGDALDTDQVDLRFTSQMERAKQRASLTKRNQSQENSPGEGGFGSPKSMHSTKTSDDLGRMKSDLKVQQCTFLTKEGRIRKPKPELARVCGPCCRPRLESLMSKIEHRQDTEHTGCFVDIVNTSAFHASSTFAIFANYIFILITTDWKMTHINATPPAMFRIIDLSFTSYYVIELLLGMLAYRLDFFLGADCSWNWFDFFIVLFSVMQEVLNTLDIQSIDTSFLRVLRFLRVSKLLRMFDAMKAFKDIKIMIDAISGSFMVFVMCVLMMVMYLSIFAIFFVQGFTSKMEQEEATMDPVLKGTLERDWGSVVNAMISLFMTLTGGQDWVAFYRSIEKLGTMYTSLFFFFLFFALMSFFNVITGVFCEKAMSLARPGPHEQMVRRRHKEMRDATELIGLLKKILHIREPFPPITKDQFEQFLEREEAITYFEVRGLSPIAAKRFFLVLVELHHTDAIEFVQFISYCVKLDGPASSIDLHVLDMELKTMQVGVEHIRRSLDTSLKELTEVMESIPARGSDAALERSFVESAPRGGQHGRSPSGQRYGNDTRHFSPSQFPSQDQNMLTFGGAVVDQPNPSLHPPIFPDDEFRPVVPDQSRQNLGIPSPSFSGDMNNLVFPETPFREAHGSASPGSASPGGGVFTFHFV